MTIEERLIKHYDTLGFLVPRLIEAPIGTSIRFDIKDNADAMGEDCAVFLAELIFQFMEVENIGCLIKRNRIRVAVNSRNEIFYIKQIETNRNDVIEKYYDEHEDRIRNGTIGCGNMDIVVETLTFKDDRYSLIYRRW